MSHNILSPILLFWITLACAAPISDDTFTAAGNSIGYGTGGGIAGLIILILDIIVIGMKSQPVLDVEHLRLTDNSRGSTINSSGQSQTPLDPRRPLVPAYRHDPLLPILQPRSPQVWRLI